MADWIFWVAYGAGWLAACRVLAWRYPREFDEGGLLGLGAVALLWPLLAAVALFALPVWLVTRGVDR